MVFLYLTAAYLTFNNRAKLRPDPSVEMRLTSDATFQTASLLRVKLVAMEVTVMFPGRKPPWLSDIVFRGKPCVNWTLAADQ